MYYRSIQIQPVSGGWEILPCRLKGFDQSVLGGIYLSLGDAQQAIKYMPLDEMGVKERIENGCHNFQCYSCKHTFEMEERLITDNRLYVKCPSCRSECCYDSYFYR